MDVSFDESVRLVGQVVDGVGVAIVLVGAVVALVPYHRPLNHVARAPVLRLAR